MIISPKRCAVTFRYVQFKYLFLLLIVVNKSSSTELQEHNNHRQNGEERKSSSTNVENNSASTIQSTESAELKFHNSQEEINSPGIKDTDDIVIEQSPTKHSRISEHHEKLESPPGDDGVRAIQQPLNEEVLKPINGERKLSNVADNSQIIIPFEFGRGNILSGNRGGRKLSLEFKDNVNGTKINHTVVHSKLDNFNETSNRVNSSLKSDENDNNSEIVQQSELSEEITTEANEVQNKSSDTEDRIRGGQGKNQIFEFEKEKVPNENRLGRKFSKADSEVSLHSSATINPFEISDHRINTGEGRKLSQDSEETDSGPRIIPNPDVAYVASENFLEKIREHCKSEQALSIICNNLKLVIPISSQKPSEFSTTTVETVTQVIVPNERREENIISDRRYNIHKNSFTPEPLKHIPDDTQNIHLPKNVEFKELSINTDERISGAYRQHLAEMYGYLPSSRSSISSDSYTHGEDPNLDYDLNSQGDNLPNHSVSNKYQGTWDEKLGAAMEELYKKQETSEQDLNKSEEDKTVNQSFLGNKKEDYEVNTISSSHEHTTSNSDDIADFDEEEFGSGDDEFGIEQNPDLIEEGSDVDMEARSDWKTNLTKPNNTEVISKQPVRTMMERLVDTSLRKIFKNSLTIKFPTFETVTNKLKDWFNTVFSPKSRDEGKILMIFNSNF